MELLDDRTLRHVINGTPLEIETVRIQPMARPVFFILTTIRYGIPVMGSASVLYHNSATPNGVVGITCLLQRIGGLWGSYFAVVFGNRFRNYLCAAVLTRFLTRLLD
jgi:hypothetical protein